MDNLKGIIKDVDLLTGKISRASTIIEKDYEKLDNLPSINGVELTGNKSFEDLGSEEIGLLDVYRIFNKIWEE